MSVWVHECACVCACVCECECMSVHVCVCVCVWVCKLKNVHNGANSYESGYSKVTDRHNLNCWLSGIRFRESSQIETRCGPSSRIETRWISQGIQESFRIKDTRSISQCILDNEHLRVKMGQIGHGLKQKVEYMWKHGYLFTRVRAAKCIYTMQKRI